jgi:glucosamine-6-phosphate deaminase
MTVLPIREAKCDELAVEVYADNEAMGEAAAEAAAAALRQAVSARGTASVVFASANSQLTFLKALRQIAGIPWPSVTAFHMDEYQSLPAGHPAGFAEFLRRHLLDHVRTGAFYPMPGHARDLGTACQAYERLLRAFPVDVCCLGIGENGHIAFNDPPVADFADPVWVKMAPLDEASRRQQVGEGHFTTLDTVPTHAMTMTIPALRAARTMVCIVPEKRKANAVRDTLLGPVSTACPASILRQTAHCRLYLDREAASELK